jgi:hypothetical protein
MHESVFESGWNRNTLMESHRRNIAPHSPGRGRAVIGLDWTLGDHPYSEKIYGAKDAYGYVHEITTASQNPVFPSIPSKNATAFGFSIAMFCRGSIGIGC